MTKSLNLGTEETCGPYWRIRLSDFCHRDQADWKNPRIVPGVLESGHRFVLWSPLDDQGEDQITQRALPQKSETFPSGILMKARETRILNGCNENYLLNWEKYKTEIMAYLRWSKIVEKMCRNPRSDRRPDRRIFFWAKVDQQVGHLWSQQIQCFSQLTDETGLLQDSSYAWMDKWLGLWYHVRSYQRSRTHTEYRDSCTRDCLICIDDVYPYIIQCYLN